MEAGLVELDGFDRSALPEAGNCRSTSIVCRLSGRSCSMTSGTTLTRTPISRCSYQYPQLAINIHRVTSVVDAEAYVGRLKNVETYLGEVEEQLILRADKGFYLVDWMYPRFWSPRVMSLAVSRLMIREPLACVVRLPGESPKLELSEDEEAHLLNAGAMPWYLSLSLRERYGYGRAPSAIGNRR